MSDQEPIPGSVFNPRQVRTLKIVVIVMTILLVLGFALLIAGLYYQATKIGEEREAREAGRERTVQTGSAGGEVTVRVPAGAEVERIVADGGRVVLHLKGAGTEEIVIVDTARDNAITRLRLAPR
jgi:hypothetical protein